MHVLIAPDAFGGALGAHMAGRAIAKGWSRGALHDSVEICPLSDGGQDFTDLVARALGMAVDTDGLLLVPGTRGTLTGYIDSYRPGRGDQSTRDLADGISRALEAGVTRIVIGLPAPHEVLRAPDAGAGLLAALGALSQRDSDLAPSSATALGMATPADLHGLRSVRHRLRPVDLVGATATDIPLLGLHGASASAAAAGALAPDAAQDLERALGHFVHAMGRAVAGAGDLRTPLALAGSQTGPEIPTSITRTLTSSAGTGAGGGLGCAILALGGRLVAGTDLFGTVAQTSQRAEQADLVVTARGDLDGATFHGSALALAVRAAGEWGIPSIALARTSVMSKREQASVGLNALVLLSGAAGTGLSDPRTTERELTACAERLARTWSPVRALGHT